MITHSIHLGWEIWKQFQGLVQEEYFIRQVGVQNLTLVLLNPDIPCFANSVDPDQLASEEANWSGSALFAIKYANL